MNASDLLDDDGRIDISEVKRRTHTHTRTGQTVTPADCRRLRRAAVETRLTAADLGAGYGVKSSTVCDHLRGRCTCEHDHAPLRFDRQHQPSPTGPSGEWVIDA